MKIRQNLTQSHDRVWREIAQPGTWLTGQKRVAVGAETRAARQCSYCQERKVQLSPAGVSGEHTTPARDLSSAEVELVHKLVSDPGRITRRWVEQLWDAGLSDAEYVEIAGVVSAVIVVDTFHAALGLPLRALPLPQTGEPSRRRPRTAVLEQSYVPMIPVEGLVDDYVDLYQSGAFVPNVHRAFSLVPELTRLADDLMAAHYFRYEQVPGYTDADHDYAVNKMQMELIAARVSRHNDCFY